MVALRDRWRHADIAEGEARGEEKGKAEGINIGVTKMLELIKSGVSPDEAWQRVLNDQEDQQSNKKE